MKQEYKNYIEQERMTTKAEMMLVKWSIEEKIKEAKTPQELRYIRNHLKDLDRMMKYHEEKLLKKTQLERELAKLNKKR